MSRHPAIQIWFSQHQGSRDAEDIFCAIDYVFKNDVNYVEVDAKQFNYQKQKWSGPEGTPAAHTVKQPLLLTDPVEGPRDPWYSKVSVVDVASPDNAWV